MRSAIGDRRGGAAPARRWALGASVLLGAFALYLYSMPKTVVLEDDGAFILAAWANGVAHPPGYPLFTWVGHLFTWLPWGSVAARVHAASALFGAVGCLLFYLLAQRLLGVRWVAVAGAGVLACSAVFWSQAIVAEVYTLNVAFFLLLFLVALEYRERGGRRLLASLALLYGLSLANHWPLIGLSTPALLWLVANRWREIARSLWWSVPLGLCGLLPYAWMYWNSQASEIAFFGPLEGWRELWFYLSREGYGEIDHQPTADWHDKLAYAGLSLRLIVEQFSWFSVLLGGIGAVAQFRLLPPAVIGAIVVGVLGNTVALALLLGFEDEPLFHSVFRVYPMVAFALGALWIACGMRWLGEWFARRRVGAWAGVAVAAVAVGSTLAVNGGANFRQGDRWAEGYATALLESLPRDAVLFLSADTDTNTVAYFRLVEGVRPDVELYHEGGNLFANRLFDPIATPEAEQWRRVARFAERSGRPVFFVELPNLGWGREIFWLYSRGTPDDPRIRIDHLDGSPLYRYFERILRMTDPTDPWTAMHRRLLIADMVPALAGRVALGTRDAARDGENLALATRRLEGKLALLEWLLGRNDPRWWPVFEREAEAAEALLDDAYTKRQRAELALLRGRYARVRGDLPAARAQYLKAMERWPAPANAAYREFREMIGESGAQVGGGDGV